MYNKEDKEMYRCFVTMLTHDSGGASAEGEGESLFEELKRNVAVEVHTSLSALWFSPKSQSGKKLM